MLPDADDPAPPESESESDPPLRCDLGEAPLADPAGESRFEVLADLAILDTPPEQGFDDIVALAAEICDAPVALISLVDRDRQWFKARRNFAPPQTPLSHSVCAHALESRDLLVIPDLTRDPRTAENPLVTGEPRIRFYAGAPLIVDGNVPVGSLCVIDHAPRPEGLSERRREALRRLAGQVVTQFELRRALAARDDLVARLHRAHEATAAERRRLFAMFERAPSFMALLRGATHVFEMTNPAYRAVIDGRNVVGMPIAEALPDAAAQGFVAILDRVYASGEPVAMEAARFVSQGQPGGPAVERYLDFVYQPIAEDGAVSGIFVEGYDVTERIRQIRRQEALADLGDRLRDLGDVGAIAHAAAEIMARAMSATRAGFGTVDAARETVFMHPNWCAPGSAPVEGLHRFRDYGSFIDDLVAGRTVVVEDVTRDPRTEASAAALLAIGIRVLVNLPVVEHGRLVLVVFLHYDDLRALSADDLAFVGQIGDRTQAAIARVRAEALQRVLNQELSHRLKNTLAMVQAIAGRTLRTVTERDAVEAFTQRIHALSAAHEVLLQQNWAAAPIRRIVSGALATFHQPERFRLAGPDLDLGPKAGLSVTLVLHELATNALKYGSLSAESGHVEIDWRVEARAGVETFVLAWREVGGPPPAAREGRGGFGSRLLRMGLLGTGDAVLDFAPTGLRAEMTAPLAELGRS